jgi:hypothetical protein
LQLVIDCDRQLPMRAVTTWTLKEMADEAIRVAWSPVGIVQPAFERINYDSEVWTR